MLLLEGMPLVLGMAQYSVEDPFYMNSRMLTSHVASLHVASSHVASLEGIWTSPSYLASLQGIWTSPSHVASLQGIWTSRFRHEQIATISDCVGARRILMVGYFKCMYG